MKLLITSGGTEEPIDGVRYISNFSTGRTGAVLADRMIELGADVTLLHGHRAILPLKNMEMDSFTSFTDLDEKLQNRLRTGKYDALIHLAAVSDYSVDYIETENGERITVQNKGKLSSEENISLHLKRNYKIIDRLKSYKNTGKGLIVAGFKLTDTDSIEIMENAVRKLLKSGKIDFVVQNNLRDITGNKHPAKIYSSAGEVLFDTETKMEMAEKLFSLIKDISGDAKHQDPNIVGKKDISGDWS